MKLSGTVAQLLEGAGISSATQPSSTDDDSAHAALREALRNVMAANRQDEASGVFHNADGTIITDRSRIALEQQIYDLKPKRTENGGVIDELSPAGNPAPAPTPAADALAAAAAAKVVTLKPNSKLSPAEPRPYVEPPFPAPRPVTAEPSSTALFYEYNAGRSSGPPGSVDPSWPRLR